MPNPNLSPELLQLFNRIIDSSPEKPGDELREQMIISLTRELDDYLLSGAIDALPDEHFEAYDTLMQSRPDGTQVRDFFRQHIPNIDQVFAKAVNDFSQDYLPEADQSTEV